MAMANTDAMANMVMARGMDMGMDMDMVRKSNKVFFYFWSIRHLDYFKINVR